MSKLWVSILGWFDSWKYQETADTSAADSIDWVRVIPFLGVHVACLGVIWVGWSLAAVAVAVALLFLRVFAVTGFYHRYFSHRSFKTSRPVQFLMAILGNTSAQRGPLWWAAHHRFHHRHSDDELDRHSPHQHGLLWSHMLWFTTRSNFRTDLDQVKDLAKFPELRWLDRFDWVVPLALAVSLFVGGEILARTAPQLGTNGWQLLIWGFFISTVAVFHLTCLVNSAAHLVGKRRFATHDHSRNSFLLALFTFGEGWHNNHHHYPASTRQGFYWWEIDITYYLLWTLSKIGIISDLRPVPLRILEEGRGRRNAPASSSMRPE